MEAADAPQPILAALGARRDPLTGTRHAPDEMHRALGRLDGDALDAAVGAWLTDRLRPPGPRRRRAVAVDDKTNEISRFQPLLAGLELTGTIVTADALHTQRDHATFLVTCKQADYLFIVEGNQPGLHAQVLALPWRDIPVLDRTRDQGHGRVELRALKVATVPVGLPRRSGHPAHPPCLRPGQPTMAHRHHLRREANIAAALRHNSRDPPSASHAHESDITAQTPGLAFAIGRPTPRWP
jgi:predicted transposase YbfD/YdcC